MEMKNIPVQLLHDNTSDGHSNEINLANEAAAAAIDSMTLATTGTTVEVTVAPPPSQQTPPSRQAPPSQHEGKLNQENQRSKEQHSKEQKPALSSRGVANRGASARRGAGLDATTHRLPASPLLAGAGDETRWSIPHQIHARVIRLHALVCSHDKHPIPNSNQVLKELMQHTNMLHYSVTKCMLDQLPDLDQPPNLDELHNQIGTTE